MYVVPTPAGALQRQASALSPSSSFSLSVPLFSNVLPSRFHFRWYGGLRNRGCRRRARGLRERSSVGSCRAAIVRSAAPIGRSAAEARNNAEPGRTPRRFNCRNLFTSRLRLPLRSRCLPNLRFGFVFDYVPFCFRDSVICTGCNFCRDMPTASAKRTGRRQTWERERETEVE